MASRQEVVVVDGLPETTEVLRAVFEPQGIIVSRRKMSSNEPLDVSGVLVTHEPGGSNGYPPRIIVGRIPEVSAEAPSRLSIPQPFQYGELIEAITEVASDPLPKSGEVPVGRRPGSSRPVPGP